MENSSETISKEKKKSNKFLVVNLVLVGLFTVSLITNQVVFSKTKKLLGINSAVSDISAKLKKIIGGNTKLTGNIAEDAVKISFHQGVPDIYGTEMGVSFEEVQQAMDIMKQYDPGYGSNKISLNADEMKRYIDVNIKISCEYCCGAKSIIFENGEAACGCAHSQAMRGLAAYLIRNHGGEFTNDQMLRELAIWKGRYFPKQMIQKVTEQLQSGKYTPDVASLLLDLKLPKYSEEQKSAPLPSDIKDLPGMVGGC